MKVLLHPLNQTPIKPVLPTFLRHLVQYDIIRRILIYQGYTVEVFRYVDDTSLQVAKLMSVLKREKIPKENILLYLGRKYVKANQTIDNKEARKVKILLEKSHFARTYLLPALKEEKQLLRKMGFFVGPIYWESSGLKRKKELIEWLIQRKRLLSFEKYGGDTFLDYTDEGLKLMKLFDQDTFTFLFKILLFFYHKASPNHLVIICHSEQEQALFANVEAFLKERNIKCLRFMIARVGIEGKVLSSRYGGWENYTIEKILEGLEEFSQKDINLGLRLYFSNFRYQNRFNFEKQEFVRWVIFAKKVNNFLKTLESQKEKLRKIKNPKTNEFKKKLLDKKIIGNHGKLRDIFFLAQREAKKGYKKGRIDPVLIKLILDLRQIFGS